jgi:membrane protein
MALVRRDQGVRDDEVSTEASGAQPDPVEQKSGIAGLIQTVMALRPVRVFLHYSNDNGPLIASGMTYQAIFALFAGLWFAISIAGFVIKGDTVLQDHLFMTLNQFIPNLIKYSGAPDGAIDVLSLLNSTALSWSGAISLVGVLFTAVGFLATLRTAIRIMFDLPNPTTSFVILKLKDLGLTIAFGAVVLLTAVISVVSNTALDAVLSLLGLGDASALQQVGTTAVTFVVLAIIDTGILMAAFRILSGIPIPFRRLLVGSLIGGIGLTVLQTLGTSLLHASSNPIVGAFATLVGVLLYFNFVCQVILIAASWVDVGMADAGIDPRSLSPEQREQEQAEQLEQARRLVADANREALEDRIRDAHGLRRWRLVRELQREVKAEARRRQEVPTASEYRAAQQETGEDSPDAREVQKADV